MLCYDEIHHQYKLGNERTRISAIQAMECEVYFMYAQ